MAGNPGLVGTAWDSASCVKGIVVGVRRFPFQTFTPPKISVKTDMPRDVGQMLAVEQTPGAAEISNGSAEMKIRFWQGMLQFFGEHGMTLTETTIHVTIGHPTIAGYYAEVYDRCRIVGLEGPELKGDEKALTKKLDISAMGIWMTGTDGKYRCLTYNEKLASRQAKMLMRL